MNGESKYGSGKALRGFIDLVYIWFIYKYSQRPLHFFGYMDNLPNLKKSPIRLKTKKVCR